jgi:hypothetical protein
MLKFFKRNLLTIKKVLLFLILLIFLDFVVGEIIFSLYKKAKFGVSAQEYYSMMKTNEELLIFGSSRAAYHFNPDIISKNTNLTAYNLGREGLGIHYHHALLLGILERYKPKVILLDLNYSDIYKSNSNFNEHDLRELRPFYNKVSNKMDSLLTYDEYDKIFLQSNSFRYNKKVIRIFSGNLFSIRSLNKGYRPLEGITDKKISSYDVKKNIDEFKISKLLDFIKMCNENQIKLILISSPFYANFDHDVNKPIEEIAKKYNLEFIDYLQNKNYLSNVKYFYDLGHLNSEGADKFSNEITSFLTH